MESARKARLPDGEPWVLGHVPSQNGIVLAGYRNAVRQRLNKLRKARLQTS
jgi:hypothetical protein